jgi:hypothetical protein
MIYSWELSHTTMGASKLKIFREASRSKILAGVYFAAPIQK